MGAPKSAHNRKGKKAWRKNIDAADVEAVLEETAAQDVRAPKPETLPDDQLFFIDTGGDDSLVTKASRRRREARPLRSQVVLEAGRAAKPLWAPPKHRIVGRLRPQRPAGAAAAAAAAAAEGGEGAAEAAAAAGAGGGGKKKAQRRAAAAARKGAPLQDMWAEGLTAAAAAAGGAPPTAAAAAAADWNTTVNATDFLRAGRRQRAHAQQQQRRAAAAAVNCGGSRLGRGRGNTAIAAVQVDAPGCSFNPEPEAHQDALAALVAAQVKKEIAQELAPRPPPATVPVDGLSSAPRDPVLALLGAGVDGLAGEEEGEEGEEEGEGKKAAAAADPNAIELFGEEGEEGEEEGEEEEGGVKKAGGAAAAAGGNKKTRVDRNREARRKAADAAGAARAALKRQRRELEALDEVAAALAAEEAAAAARRLRLATVRAERAAVAPPRLGRLRFVESPAPVLTSDEITGSLRRLAPYPMVASDRFRALQRRGVIEVRRPAGEKRKRKQAEYVHGARAEGAAARQAEVDGIRRARVKAGRKARKADARAAAAAGGGSGGGGGGGGVLDSELAAATVGW